MRQLRPGLSCLIRFLQRAATENGICIIEKLSRPMKLFFLAVAALFATCDAFVPPAASAIARASRPVAAVDVTMLFGAKKPKAAKKVAKAGFFAKKPKAAVKKANFFAKGKVAKVPKKAVRDKAALSSVNIGFENKLPFPIGQVVDAINVLRELPNK